jgi:hypothetical protein
MKGIATPERMSILKPKFGAAQGGIEMGLAFSALQRTFLIDETIPEGKSYYVPSQIPMDLFFRNVGKRHVEFEFHSDFKWSPPDVVNSRGEPMEVLPLTAWLLEPTYTVSLKPGEAFGIPTRGIGVCSYKCPLRFAATAAGEYRVSFASRIDGIVDEGWSEFTTGKLKLRVLDADGGKQTVQLLVAHGAPPVEPNHEARLPSEAGTATTKTTGKGKSVMDSIIWWEKVGGLQAGF